MNIFSLLEMAMVKMVCSNRKDMEDPQNDLLKIDCTGCFTISRYTFWDTIFFDEKSIIQAILRYMGPKK